MKSTFFGKVLSVALQAALLAGFAATAQAQVKTIKIGNVEPLSGASASVGVQGKQAREMAVEEINAAGGIKSLGGAKLELVYADSKSDPTVGVTETERLINSEKVPLVTGCWNSAVTLPASQVAERYGVPFVVPVAVNDTITERGFKYTFRIAAKDGWWVRDQFRFLKDMQEETGVKLKTVAFVYENGDWGTGFAKKWVELAKQDGYQVVLNEPYPSTQSDLTPIINKIKTANPDALLLVSNAADAILLTNTMAEMKVKPKVILASGGGHADPKYLSNAGKNALYLFDEVEWNTDVNKPGAKEANAKFKTKNGYDLAGESVDAYVAMYVIADALERAASTDPKKLRDALAATNLKTGPGMIVAYDAVQFDESGQNKNASIVIVQVAEVDGKLDRVTVWPKNARRAGYKPVFPTN